MSVYLFFSLTLLFSVYMCVHACVRCVSLFSVHLTQTELLFRISVFPSKDNHLPIFAGREKHKTPWRTPLLRQQRVWKKNDINVPESRKYTKTSSVVWLSSHLLFFFYFLKKYFHEYQRESKCKRLARGALMPMLSWQLSFLRSSKRCLKISSKGRRWMCT